MLELKIVDSNYFQFLSHFHFLFLLFLFLNLGLGINITLYIIVIITELCNLKKDIKELRTNDVIQHSNSILIL